MESRTFRRSAVALAIAGAFAIGVTTADKVSMHAANAAVSPPTVSTPAISAPSNVAPVAALPDFSGLVEKYGPAVVNISVTSDGRKLTADEDSSTPDMDQLPPFLRDSPFFRNLPTPQQRGPMRGMGSGFIVSSDGVILTNAHVVANADEVTVKLTDRREFKAKVLGSDKTTDIAALKIDAKNLPVVKIGDPAQTRVGEWVVAIGQPYGFENTVTAGIVSAKARALPQDSYVPFIQTDAAVNPGNSGGPLFNLKGEAIGINTAIIGGANNIGFAVPITLVKQILPQLKDAAAAAQQEARFAVLALSSAGGSAPFDSALRRYVDFLTADGQLEVDLEIQDGIRLAPDEQIEVFRIVQEGLANARKHAGARRAEVRIEERVGERFVTVVDDGSGFVEDEIAAGQGLKNMRARAASIGGGFRLVSKPGRGTALEVVLRA